MGAPIQISVYDDKMIVWNEGNLPDNMTVFQSRFLMIPSDVKK